MGSNVFFDEAELPRVEAALEALLADGTVTMSLAHINRDGSKTSLEYSGAVTRNQDGSPQYLIFVGRDVTKRVRAEAALKASEEKYRDLVEEVSDVIYAINADGEITYVNPAVRSVIGLDPAGLIGEQFAKYIHPRDEARLRDDVRNLMAGAEPRPAEYRLVTVTGDIRWIRVTSQERLASVERRYGVNTAISTRGAAALDTAHESDLYAVATEALNNSLKHAQAETVTVTLEVDDRRCVLTVTDDGIGFDPESDLVTGGRGLQTMNERAESMGGLFSLRSSAGAGTTVRVETPN